MMRYVLGCLTFLIAISFANAQAVDALDEVNATRAQAGLPPYQKDEGLTQAAMSAAQSRANANWAGHTQNDFAHIPAGTSAEAAGCGAWAPGEGWGTCCTYDNYSHAGAAYVVANGRRFMHLFVRGPRVQRAFAEGLGTGYALAQVPASCATGSCAPTTTEVRGGCTSGSCSSQVNYRPRIRHFHRVRVRGCRSCG